MTFEYTDADGDLLHVSVPATPAGPGPCISIHSASHEPVHVPLDRVEEVVAGIRDAARTAAARQTGQQPDETVVAYWTNFPGVTLYCPEHGKDHPGLIPRTSDDLPFGGNCHTCGRDVLIPAALDVMVETDEERESREDREETERLHNAGDHQYCGPTCEVEFPNEMLRNTILYRAIPGSARMLDELLRRAAAGLDASQPATNQARPPREQWRVEGYDADEWNPVSRSFNNPQDAHARKRVSKRYPDMPTRVVRETTTWIVEETDQ